MFYLVGVIITFFLVVLLIGKKRKSTADLILTFWLIVTGFHLLFYYIFITGKNLQFPFLLGMEIPLPLAQGPFLFLYTAALTYKKMKMGMRLIHFLPIGLVYCLIIPFFSLSNEEKIIVYQNGGEGYETLTTGISICIMLSGVLYVTFSLLLLRKHKTNIREQFSYSERINLNWLRFLIWGTAAIWVWVLIGNDFLIYITAVIYMLLIGFFGIRQSGIFTSENLYHTANHPVFEENNNVVAREKTRHPKEIENEKIKYHKSGLSYEMASQAHKQLTEIMHTEKLFKSPELTLAELAEKLKINPNYLSQAINTLEQKTFYDYINQLRVEEFKQIVSLPKNKQFTMLSLAFECGFNSKTSFNRNFKKVTGLSPSEFIYEDSIVIK